MRYVLLKRLFSRGKWLLILWKVLYAAVEVGFLTPRSGEQVNYFGGFVLGAYLGQEFRDREGN